MLERWKNQDGGIVVDLDRDAPARLLLPAIENRYGPPFNIGGITYPGFWNSKAGRDALTARSWRSRKPMAGQ